MHLLFLSKTTIVVYMKYRRKALKRSYSPDLMRIIGRAAIHGPSRTYDYHCGSAQYNGQLLQFTILRQVFGAW